MVAQLITVKYTYFFSSFQYDVNALNKHKRKKTYFI